MGRVAVWVRVLLWWLTRAPGARSPATGRLPGRSRTRRTRALASSLASAGLLACASTVVAPPAGAAVVTGPAWPRGVITYHVMAPVLRWPVARAVAEWNASGAHVRFVEAPAAQASLRVVPFRSGSCLGIVGLAPVGALPRGSHYPLYLQRRCSRYLLVDIAAHELGHSLGLAHEDRRCAVMNSVAGAHCRFDLLPWEWVCHPLQADDVRGAIRLYGGHVRPVRSRICLSAATPAPATAVRIELEPADTLAATRISWTNPASASLRRVVVNRAAGATCPTFPGGSYAQRPDATRPGDLVADVIAGGRGTTQSVLESGAPEAGHWCYAIWTIGPQGRYELAAVRHVVRARPTDPATRIGLVAAVAPAPGVRVRLTWTTPHQPAFASVTVLRSPEPCPAGSDFFGGEAVASTAPAAGPTSIDDSPSTLPGGTWCYALDFAPAGNGSTDTVRATIQVSGVPGPPDAPPVASFEAPDSAGVGESVYFFDASYDDDGVIVAYAWSFGDGATVATQDPGDHVYTVPGTYTVTLVVTDDRGATATTSRTVTISP